MIKEVIIVMTGALAGSVLSLILLSAVFYGYFREEIEHQQWINANLRKALFKACKLLEKHVTELKSDFDGYA